MTRNDYISVERGTGRRKIGYGGLKIRQHVPLINVCTTENKKTTDTPAYPRKKLSKEVCKDHPQPCLRDREQASEWKTTCNGKSRRYAVFDWKKNNGKGAGGRMYSPEYSAALNSLHSSLHAHEILALHQ